VSGDDSLTFWLKMFLAFWVGMLIGMAALGWILGAEFDQRYIVIRVLIATPLAAILATFRLFGRIT